MLRKSILALAAVAALGTAALTPTTASAHWYGHGWYGYGKPSTTGMAGTTAIPTASTARAISTAGSSPGRKSYRSY